MKIFIKTISIILILVLCLPTLTGCYDSRGIELLAYVIAIGIDKGETNALKLSLQITTLTDSNSSGGSSSQYNSATVISVECSSIDDGINLVNSYISKKINLSHCKAIVISEELAYEGVSEYIFTVVNNMEVRPNCNVLISKSTAYDFLSSFKPSLESVSARYYELILSSSEYSGYTDNIYISDFYENLLGTTSQASAILVNINNENLHKTNKNSADNLNGKYLAGETPIEAPNKTEIMGITAFNGDKLVGELNGFEALCHLIITNKLGNTTITIPSPFHYNSNISLSVGLHSNTKHSVELINDYPFITCDVKLTANLLSMDYNIDLTKQDNLVLIEDYLKTYLTENIIQYLYKTSKELKSDIAGFGEYVIPKYLTWDSWLDSDWLNNYQNATFKVNVEANVESGYLFTKI